MLKDFIADNITMIQLFLIFILFLVINALIVSAKSDKKLYRINSYSVKPTIIERKSLLDRLLLLIWNYISKISCYLKKIKCINKYSKRYDKCISYEEKNERTGLDYISIKIIFVIIALLINFIRFLIFKINPFSFILFALVGYLIPTIIIIINYKKKVYEVHEDLIKAIIIMNNAFKSNKTIIEAISNVVESLDGAIADEFKKIGLDLSYGLNLEVAFDRFNNRMKMKDTKYISSSLIILNKTGGNISEIFDTILEELLNNKRLNKKLNVMTTITKLIVYILYLIPIVLIFVITFIDKEYYKIIFSNYLGIGMILVSLLLYIIFIICSYNMLKEKEL